MKYDADFKSSSIDILPTHKRTDILDLTDSLIEPLNDVNILFKWFREGNTAGQFDVAVSYSFGQVVRYSRRIYLRNEATTGYAAGVIPTNDKYWKKVADLFIGIDERIKYRTSKISLEYALNRHFETTFRNPPLVPDIYINTLNTSNSNLGIGALDLFTSTISEFDSSSLYFVGVGDFVVGEKDYTIFIPTAVYNALGATNTERDLIVSGVVTRYGLAGYTFNITTY
jgi:hypothetical protein